MTTANRPRVEPVAPPFLAELQAVFDRIMPPGVPPLALFTTLARVPRIYERFRAGSLLDRGPVSLRHGRSSSTAPARAAAAPTSGRARRVLRPAGRPDRRADSCDAAREREIQSGAPRSGY